MNQLVGPLFRRRSLRAGRRTASSTACRNAMVASTALAAGRRERDETQEFVDSGTRPTSSPGRRRTSLSPSGPARLRQRHRRPAPVT